MRINDVLFEFAPSGDGGGSGDYFQALASAWYNGTFDTGSLQKGIKSQQDVEQLLQRGIIGPDGVTRKYGIDYNSTFDGVVISSDDYYEHADHDETDSRTGKPFGPYDYMEFGDEELDEGLNEVDRRGFLKGAGATAAAAAASQATAGLPLFVPIPNPTQSDPPLKLSLRLPWKHKHENLTKEDQRIIANLIHILYLARMTEQQDLYQLAYTTISEINDAFADVDIGKSMNFFKKRLENAQTSNPNQFDQFSKYFLNPSVYDKIIAAGKKLATNGPGAVTQEPQQSQPSKTFETMMIDRMLRLYFYAKQANDPVQVDVMRLLTLYNMSKNASAQSPKDVINIPERYNELQKELSGNSDIQERLSRQHLANAQQIMAEFKKTFATTQQVDPDLEQKRRENLQRMQGIASQDSPTRESVEQGVAEGDLNEFVPAGRGPGDDDEEPGDDPYKSPKPEAYGRSIDFFGRFEADHFDKEHMDDATGVFKGYWDYDGDMKQIAYFKFDDPARTGSDDPGMGWYYEPQNESVAEGIDDEEYGPELAALKKEFGKFTQHYDRMDQDSAYAAQWRKQNTDRLNREVPDDDMTGTATDDMVHDMGQDDEDSIREGKPREKEADYGADYQDMVSRVKKLAGLGPLKTVYDPQKRVYKNVPRAVQPKKEQR